MLARVCAPNSQNHWDEYLPDVLLAHHAHENPSLRASPFYLTYGRHPRLPNDHIYDVVRKPPTDQEIELLQNERLEHVKDLGRFRNEANEYAFARLQKEADKRENSYREEAIGVGDLVKLTNQGWLHSSSPLQRRPPPSLLPWTTRRRKSLAC
ncbi:hypothetical protein BDW22DRAFT_680813 [Trametopsis cervina]|nr:hypothetical protein BDW22DRAFT_680813 [Trametopsis cervina]